MVEQPVISKGTSSATGIPGTALPISNLEQRALSGMTRLGPWICFRSKYQLAATNTLYVLTAKMKLSSDEKAAALALFFIPGVAVPGNCKGTPP